MDTKEKIDELHAFLCGINGADGFIKRGQKAFEKIESIEHNMVTTKVCDSIRAAKGKNYKYVITTLIAVVALGIAIIRSFL